MNQQIAGLVQRLRRAYEDQNQYPMDLLWEASDEIERLMRPWISWDPACHELNLESKPDMRAAAKVLEHLFWPEVAAEHPTNPMTEDDWLRCATSIVNAALKTDGSAR